MSTAPTTARGVRIARLVLVLVGVAVLAFGSWTLGSVERPHKAVGLLWWLIGAVVLHDGVLSPFVVLVGVLLRKAGRRLPGWTLVVVQVAVVVGAVLALVVLPEIQATHHEKNPTVVPFDYTLRLVLAEVVLGVVAVGAVAVGLRGARRRRVGGVGASGPAGASGPSGPAGPGLP
ncbi:MULTISPECIES: hypothetical protein [unclassified Curtobacterium]|uniref:hypothetical protein n=1 Tax=unclassified Curtobacterium TaxID=257496 RepID=UPI000DAA9D35|nr:MULTISPECIES: hypothetical protein [unclassified Curtobacterium]PZE73876.1 hypothetical protein DEI82_12500 [Curtobacterium sp. MCBD17_019]WIE54024.1 hypothetical protein DEI88_012985 [Curtobacterium sp. MCBD17_003]